MRKLLLSIFLVGGIVIASAQVPKASKPVCAYCGVDLTTGVSHKSNCRYYKKEQETEDKGESWAPNFNSIEYKYGHGVMCEQCERTNGHDSDCLIGKTQGYIRDYWAKSKTPESYKFLIKTYEDNIRLFAKQGREAREAKKTEKKFSYECDLCKASVMAYNINEAIREFANNPWLHKPTCKNYKPQSGQTPSTKLKDYTPAPEHPMVSEPLINMPLRQPAPQHSGINETNIRHEKLQSVIGEHEWGKIDEGLLSSYESAYGEDIPTKFDIERYNHDKGAVILGTHKDNGRYHWTILERLPNGDLRPISQKNLKEGFAGYKNIGQLTDVHFEGEGKFIIAEYTSGYRQVYNANGELMREGRNIKVLGSTVEDKRLLYVGEDEQTIVNLLLNEDGDVIVSDPIIAQYDDAIILKYGNKFNLSNWRGELLQIDDIDSFDEIKAYNNNGSHYLLKVKDEGYAVVGRGFRRVGGWYKTEEEAHRAWRASK